MMKTLHVIGDSISIHYGPYLEKFVNGRLKYSRKMGPPGDLDLGGGANGGDSSRVLAHMQECLDQSCHWDLLVLNCGLHDIKNHGSGNQVSLDQYKDNLVQIVELGKKLADEIVWVLSTPVIDEIHNSRSKKFKRLNADVERYNQAARNVMSESKIRMIDLYGFCQSILKPEIFMDHVHFVEAAREAQARFIANDLLAVFDQK
jgi:lysophospholipase L1-like esterase